MEGLLRLTDLLFGTATQSEQPERRWLARYLALAGGLGLVVFARRPDSILRPQFWAEDGTVFFYQQLTLGFWSALCKLYDGFPFLTQRLVAGLAATVSTAAVPLVYNVSAIVITALAMATFSLPGFRHLVRSDGVRATLCIATVCIPAGQELLATPTTLGYFLAVWLFFLSVMRTPQTPAGAAAWCVGSVLAVLSTPAAPLAAPFWLLRAVRGVSRRYKPDLVFGLSQMAALLVAVALLALLGGGAQLPGGVTAFVLQPGSLRAALGALGWVMAACVDTFLLPMAAFEWLEAHGTLPVVAPAAIVAVCVALIFRDLRGRGRVTVLLALYLFASSIYLVLSGRPIIVQIIQEIPNLNLKTSGRLFPAMGARHRALPNMALLLVAAGIIDGAKRVRIRVVAATVACAGLLLAWTPEFRVPPFPDLHWPIWAARLDKKLASGSRDSLVIPSHPHPFFDIAIDSPPSPASNAKGTSDARHSRQ